MIVFYLFIFFISIILILLFSSLSLDVRKLEIEDINNLKCIYNKINNKKYDEIFDYINLDITFRIFIMSIIPLDVIKINNIKIKKLVKRIMINDLKEQRKNLAKYKTKRAKQKDMLKQIQRKINPHLKIKDADLTLRIGLTNAGVTAIATGFLNIIISMILLDLVSEMLEKTHYKKNGNQLNKTIHNLNYVVKPIYSEDFAFNLKSKIKIKLPFYSLI